MASADIEAIIEIEGPPERVWQVMTDTALAWRWLGAFGFRLKVGQTFVMQPSRRRRETDDLAGAIPCRLEVIDPNRRLRFSWMYPGRPATDVAIALTPIHGGTHVRLTHEGWEAYEDDVDPADMEAALLAIGEAWSEEVLPTLKALVEG
ncbi:SRPBCC domain-containing protein [Phenylobacterium sp. J426]|uniref:SRPBCC family protein n=1 Tax=Phenylobacterium sp. J426 TaxID=2898439 RepID=UPI002150ECA3|nr:SRPBCC domain-containing protein [Phenylobacterium sp. J426]MCR5873369.1 SRPBCC domain-containing protein [Phenylobacterium sp. J426]